MDTGPIMSRFRGSPAILLAIAWHVGACAEADIHSRAGGGGMGTTLPASTITLPEGSTSSCGNHCSSDLHNVLDCNDQLVSTCPPNEGCSSTGCIPACDSATANKSTIGCDY